MAATWISPSFPPTCLFSGNERIKLYSNVSAVQSSRSQFRCVRVKALEEKTEEIKKPSTPEEITKTYGLEAGLWKIFNAKEDEEFGGETKKSKGDQAKELLAKYGGAYLATSIALSLIFSVYVML